MKGGDGVERVWAEVSTDAVVANYRAVRERLTAHCRVMASVKADAYGHGAVPVAKALEAAGADWLAVSHISEAAELRQAGITLPLLLLAYTPPAEAARLAALGAAQAVSDGDYAAALNAAAEAAGVTVEVHIKLDTGMGRIGFVCYDGDPADAIAAACALPHLNATGIFTHFAMADVATPEADAFTKQQFARFTETTRCLAERGVTFPLRHCCNSAAALRFPEMHLDMVRPGIVLYGLAPDEALSLPITLTPAMTLCAAVGQVKTVPAGTPISYGGTAVTARRSVLATVPLGYADGLPRACSGRIAMAVRGHLAPLLGRVCMDQCVLDVTDIPDVQPGDTVTVFGESPSAAALAAGADTIAYEIVCRLGRRVVRIYQ